jgi:hypothetical protein
MKSKGAYILFPVVLVIWGFIAYRFVGFLKQDNVAVSATKTEEISIKPENFVQDTFSIVADYRDPFLGVLKKEPLAIIVPKPVVLSPKPVVKQNVPWPLISYHGSIKNTGSGKVYAMVKINNKLKNLSVDDELDGIRIVEINRESIVVMLNNEKRIFTRNKKDEKNSKQTTN